MNRFIRQEQIEGWDQSRIAGTTVAICGRGWISSLCVQALASMGFGKIIWLGRPDPECAVFDQWMLADSCPFPNTTLIEFPIENEYEAEMKSLLAFAQPDVLIDCTGDTGVSSLLEDFAQSAKIPLVQTDNASHPCLQILNGALLSDWSRELILPLAGKNEYSSTHALLRTPAPRTPFTIVIIGVGAIGTYAALGLARCGFRIIIFDFDRVEESNLNRQGFYAGLLGAAKSEACCRFIRWLMPESRIEHFNEAINENSASRLHSIAPDCLVSAVDNAKARLIIQTLSVHLRIPVVQAGTLTFGAECYTQQSEGPTLDEQMRGELSRAMSSESQRRQRPRQQSCGDRIYVVPGMVAGAMIVHRVCQISQYYRGLLPMLWRAGNSPIEQETW